jgi:hypothetical protein
MKIISRCVLIRIADFKSIIDFLTSVYFRYKLLQEKMFMDFYIQMNIFNYIINMSSIVSPTNRAVTGQRHYQEPLVSTWLSLQHILRT